MKKFKLIFSVPDEDPPEEGVEPEPDQLPP